jgi:hypothetical protein
MLIYKDGIVDEVRRFFPNTSFPTSGPSDEFLEENEAYRVNTFKPHDQRTQKVVPCDPYIEDGWAYTVAVEDKTEEELDADTQSQASKVRADRNRRLAECDWTQVLDAPVDRTVWAAYREALRNLPAQEGFPHNVIWPNKPE